MSRPKAERPAARRCRAPGCQKTIPWRDGMKPSAYARLDTCSRVCGVAFGHRRRKHQCELAGCKVNVPRVEGQRESIYRRRRYCTPEHAAEGRASATRTWGGEQRTCSRDGCGVVFTPSTKEQRYHDHPCSVLARGGRVVKERQSKVCACPCQQEFDRPPGVSQEAWGRRRFVDQSHRRRGSYVPATPPEPTPTPKVTATRVPGSSRAGRRKEPRIPHAKPPRQPVTDRSVFGDQAPAALWRPPVPVVERVARVAARPSFGLSRRSA